MAFKLKSGNKPSFKNMGSSPAKQVTREQRLTDSSQSAPADATPRELEKKHKTTKEPQKAPEKQASPAKQVSETAKKVISHGKIDGKDATDFTKGARTKKDGVGTYEKGKKQIYTKQDDDTYTKETRKIKKGATSDKEWESKKTKTISAKKAERQIKRKTKRAERSSKRADVKEVRGRAKTMRKDEGLTRADKKDIKTRKKATIKAIRNR